MFEGVTQAIARSRRRARTRRATSLPRGPTWPAPLQIALWLRRPYWLLTHCRRTYGPIFSLRLARWDAIVAFSQPDPIREIFTGSPDVMWAGPANDLLEPVVGQGSLLLLDGPRHLRERKLLLPPFHGERMHRYGEVMRELTVNEIARWPLGTPFSLHPSMQAITLDVILRTVFGVEGREMDEVRAAITTFTNGFCSVNMVPSLRVSLGPRSPWGRFLSDRERVDGLLYQAIRARRAEAAQRDDVMSLLLSARYEDGAAMTERELRDELMTLLAAGHETSATALPWVFDFLARNPEIQERAREDARAGGELAYVEGVVKETMRLRPVVAAVGRVLQAPATIAGIELPAGTLVSPSVYLAHREPESWPDPTRFDPERFIGTRVSPYAYLPFGGGVRRCIGAAFATFEMKIVVAEVLRRYRVRASSPTAPRPVRRGVTMMPEGGMVAILERA
jgi:cytochrome P450